MPAPNLKEIEWAISELENEESSKNGYILLSALYTCRDHMLGQDSQQPAVYSETAAAVPDEPLGLYGDSEFLHAVSGLPAPEAWSVMDELMDTLQLVEPRVYDSVLRKLAKL